MSLSSSEFEFHRTIKQGARHRWHLLEAGCGEGSLVMFPAVGDRAESYVELFGILGKALDGVARVVAVDPPGYGPVYAAKGPPDFEELMRWAETFAREREGPIVFAGNSSGGVLAAAAASAASHDSCGLVMICWPDWRLGDPPVEKLLPADVDAAIALMNQTWHVPPALPPNMLELLVRRYRAPGFMRHVRSFDPRAAAEPYDRFLGPILFVAGMSDRLIPRSLIAASADARSRASLISIPDCGHFPHKERPHELARALVEFSVPVFEGRA